MKEPGDRRVTWTRTPVRGGGTGVTWVESGWEGTRERWFGGVYLRAGGWLLMLHRANWHEPPAWWMFRRQPMRVGR